MANGNGNGNLAGCPAWVRYLLAVAQTIGVPAIFAGALLYLGGWVIAPPIINAHIEFLKQTTESQHVISDSQAAITEAVQEIAKAEMRSDQFIEEATAIHREQLAALKTNGECLQQIKANTEN